MKRYPHPVAQLLNPADGWEWFPFRRLCRSHLILWLSAENILVSMSHWKWGMSILQSIRIKSYHSVEKLKCKFLSFIVYNSVPQNGVSFRPFSLWTFLIFWKIIFFRTGELIICEIYAHFTCMFTRYELRHLYNFISTSSFCFVATPFKIIRTIFFF